VLGHGSKLLEVHKVMHSESCAQNGVNLGVAAGEMSIPRRRFGAHRFLMEALCLPLRLLPLGVAGTGGMIPSPLRLTSGLLRLPYHGRSVSVGRPGLLLLSLGGHLLLILKLGEKTTLCHWSSSNRAPEKPRPSALRT
jgi:hypothetical protein